MSQQLINIGFVPGDGTGDTVRTASQKTNANFAELYRLVASLTTALAQRATTSDVAGGLQAVSEASGASLASAIQGVNAAIANLGITAGISYTSVLTVPGAVTLPTALSYPRGGTITVADESGACSSATPITITAQAPDTIAGQASVQLVAPFQTLTFRSNGSSLWTFA